MTYRFSEEVSARLEYYVYRLVDPRTGQTFYVGKGKGNRIFDHVNGTLKQKSDNDIMSLKSQTINDIRKITDSSGKSLEPIHIIHRHGLTSNEAFAVEAALIDIFPELTNQQAGHNSADHGVRHVQEIVNAYELKSMKIEQSHKILAINVKRSFFEDKNLLDAVRYAWVLKPEKAQKANYVFAVNLGVCKGVYVAEKWLPASDKNFSTFHALSDDIPQDRYGFIGKEAPQHVVDMYHNKRLPEEYSGKRGASNPIRYINFNSK